MSNQFNHFNQFCNLPLIYFILKFSVKTGHQSSAFNCSSLNVFASNVYASQKSPKEISSRCIYSMFIMPQEHY